MKKYFLYILFLMPLFVASQNNYYEPPVKHTRLVGFSVGNTFIPSVQQVPILVNDDVSLLVNSVSFDYNNKIAGVSLGYSHICDTLDIPNISGTCKFYDSKLFCLIGLVGLDFEIKHQKMTNMNLRFGAIWNFKMVYFKTEYSVINKNSNFTYVDTHNSSSVLPDGYGSLSIGFNITGFRRYKN